MIRDYDHHNSKELKNFSIFERLLFSTIKDKACILSGKFLLEILDNIFNRSCNRFSTLDLCSNEDESASQQDKYQKMMLTGYKRPNYAR